MNAAFVAFLLSSLAIVLFISQERHERAMALALAFVFFLVVLVGVSGASSFTPDTP